MSLPLDPDIFRTIVKYTPLISFDLLVTTPQNEVLLGYRLNKPAQNYWFDPGGRIQKGETLDEAFRRVTLQELGVAFERSSAQFLNLYDHIYEDNALGEPGYGTHYVVLAHRIRVPQRLTSLPVSQHNAFRWQPLAEAACDSQVHPLSRMMIVPLLESR